MSVKVRGSTGNEVAVSAAGEMQVRNPSSPYSAGYTALTGMCDTAGQIRVPISGSTQGLLGVGNAVIDWEEGFAASTINNSKWKVNSSGMTGAISTPNVVVLNANNTLTSASYSLLSSWRTFETGRGSDRVIGWRVRVPSIVLGAVVEIGMLSAVGVATPITGAFFRIDADGILKGVAIDAAGAEVMTSPMSIPVVNTAHDWVIVVGKNVVYFQVDDVIVGSITTGSVSASPVLVESAPAMVRCYNATATATACQVHLYRSVGAYFGGSYGFSDVTLSALAGDIAAQGITGASTGSLANWANSAAPTAATLSNSSQSYATLGGQFSFAMIAGAEADYALFGFTVPALTNSNKASTLLIRSINIDTYISALTIGAASVLIWGIGFGSSGGSLAQADGAGTKAPRRIPVGIQSFASTDIVGKQAIPINKTFSQPISVNSGEFFHVILKLPVGTATSITLRGVVGIDGSWI